MTRDTVKTIAVYAVLILLAVLVGLPSFFVAASFGFAWGLLATMAVAAGLCCLAGLLGMNGGFEVLFFGGAAAIIGFVAGLLVRVLS